MGDEAHHRRAATWWDRAVLQGGGTHAASMAEYHFLASCEHPGNAMRHLGRAVALREHETLTGGDEVLQARRGRAFLRERHGHDSPYGDETQKGPPGFENPHRSLAQHQPALVGNRAHHIAARNWWEKHPEAGPAPVAMRNYHHQAAWNGEHAPMDLGYALDPRPRTHGEYLRIGREHLRAMHGTENPLLPDDDARKGPPAFAAPLDRPPALVGSRDHHEAAARWWSSHRIPGGYLMARYHEHAAEGNDDHALAYLGYFVKNHRTDIPADPHAENSALGRLALVAKGPPGFAALRPRALVGDAAHHAREEAHWAAERDARIEDVDDHLHFKHAAAMADYHYLAQHGRAGSALQSLGVAVLRQQGQDHYPSDATLEKIGRDHLGADDPLIGDPADIERAKGLAAVTDLCKGPPSFGPDPRKEPALVGDATHHLLATAWWNAEREQHRRDDPARRHAVDRANFHHFARQGGDDDDARSSALYYLGRALEPGSMGPESVALGRAHLRAIHGTENPLVEDEVAKGPPSFGTDPRKRPALLGNTAHHLAAAAWWAAADADAAPQPVRWSMTSFHQHAAYGDPSSSFFHLGKASGTGDDPVPTGRAAFARAHPGHESPLLDSEKDDPPPSLDGDSAHHAAAAAWWFAKREQRRNPGSAYGPGWAEANLRLFYHKAPHPLTGDPADIERAKGLAAVTDLCKGPPSFGPDPREPPALVGDEAHHRRAADWWSARSDGDNMYAYHVEAPVNARAAHRWLGRALGAEEGDARQRGREHLVALHGSDRTWHPVGRP